MPSTVIVPRTQNGQFAIGKHVNLPRRTHCPHGHLLDEANIYENHSGPSGKYTTLSCRTCRNTTSIKNNRKIKLEVFSHYGTVCACCNEGRQEFLSIDHINGGGKQHFQKLGKAGTSFYRWLKQQSYPEGYRVLCMNCNQSYGHFGYCPHERDGECGN